MSKKMIATGMGGLLAVILVGMLVQAVKITLRLAVPLLVLMLILYLINEVRTGLKD